MKLTVTHVSLEMEDSEQVQTVLAAVLGSVGGGLVASAPSTQPTRRALAATQPQCRPEDTKPQEYGSLGKTVLIAVREAPRTTQEVITRVIELNPKAKTESVYASLHRFKKLGTIERVNSKWQESSALKGRE